MQLNVIIVDDEIDATENLKSMLENFVVGVNVLATYNNPQKAITFIENQDFDILFLDVRMPNINGFELLAQVKRRNFQVVFVTAFDRFALNAIKANALDYLIKPINTADLKKVIKKVTDLKLLISQNNLNKSESGTYSRSLMSLIEQVNTPTAYQQTITIEHNKKINIISVDDIQFINSHSKSVFINHFKKGDFFVDITLKEFEEMLDPEIFIRCHQSYIVNKNFISEIEANRSGIIKLSTQIEIPISARKKSHVLKILG